MNNAEKVTAELSGNKDIGGTLHYLKETSAQLNTTIAELSVQFKKIGGNLTEAGDTVKTPAVAAGLAFQQKIYFQTWAAEKLRTSSKNGTDKLL